MSVSQRLSMRCGGGSARPLVVLAVLIAATLPAASQPTWAAVAGDFAKVCVAALLAPDALPAALKERGMVNPGPLHRPPGFDGEVYAATDGERGITVGYQRYSDLTIATCTTTVLASASMEQLQALRTELEAHPRIGKLEGRILTAMPTVHIATFKRPGNSPIVTVNINTSGKATSLTMNRFDLQPEM